MIVRERIEERFPSLSGRSARLMIERYKVSALGGIARRPGVNAPTVTRFVQRLGCNRFIDFQRAIGLAIQGQEASRPRCSRRSASGRSTA